MAKPIETDLEVNAKISVAPQSDADNAIEVLQGKVLIGSTTPQDITGTGIVPPFQILGPSATQMVVAQYSDNANPSAVNLMKSRGALNDQGIVADGDDIGRVNFRASDGVNFQAAASVRSQVDGTPSAGSMGGRLTLWTTPSGSVLPLERARINNAGVFGVNTTTLNDSAQFQIASTTRGFLPPWMTSVQRLAIATPAEGLLVFDTDLNTLCEYSGVSWKFELRLNTIAIQASTSNAYANVTGFVTPSLEAGLYVLELKGIMQSATLTTGVGLRLFNGTAAVSTVNVNWTFSQGVNGTDKNYEYNQINIADNLTSISVITVNTNFPVFGNGVFRITTAGTMAIQIRSEVNGSGVSIRPDSTVMFKKIG